MTALYRHPLSQKWADIGVPPLIELLSRRHDPPATIFGRLFVKPAVAATQPESNAGSTEALAHDAIDALLNLVGLSTHYESAAQAYAVVHENADKNADALGVVERLGGVDALISYLARWGGHPKEALRCVEILGTLETLNTRDIQEQQREQLVDCFARWLSEYKEQKMLAILPYLKTWMKEDWFANLFLERHGFFPALRLLNPTSISGARRPSEKVKVLLLEVCQMGLHGDARKRMFVSNGGIDLLVHALQTRPSEEIVMVVLGVLARLASSEEAVDAFVASEGVLYLANLLQSRKKFSTQLCAPLIKIIRRIAMISSMGIPEGLRNRLVASLKAVKSEAASITKPDDGMVVVGESIAVEADKALSSLKALADRTEALSTKNATMTASDDQGFGDDHIGERPPPIIDFDVNIDITDASIATLIPLLYAREFHVRAEAANIVRRVTIAKGSDNETVRSPQTLTHIKIAEFLPLTVQQLTRALMTLLDDDSHIAVQAAEALASLAAVASHRPIMAGCHLLAKLLTALCTYNVILLEQILQALRPFVSEDAYSPELCTTKSLRALRVVVHAATAYGESARYSYQKLLDFGDTNLQVESQHLINQDPWEQVVIDWRSDDFAKFAVPALTATGRKTGRKTRMVKARTSRTAAAR
ncbi:hypothetical protein HDU87_006225 [Geranomyces variabilis]|uniref:ARM repeat-containing protein n=1 Tax=Geranomyces variabilis TaxID=109894 RepID=A0AAD5TI35_9FUNG|nr:hypothetical protein HDU87_006225 [Geranomyces variabilis]